MEVGNWILEKELCRCCHSEGIFEDLGLPWINEEGRAEVYSLMLRDYFNITMTRPEGVIGTVAFSICTACRERLQDVSNFKQQVLKCEEKFQIMISKNKIFKSEPPEVIEDATVKFEIIDDFSDADDCIINSLIEGDEVKVPHFKVETSTNKGKGKRKATAKRKVPLKKRKVNSNKVNNSKNNKKVEVKKEEPVTTNDSGAEPPTNLLEARLKSKPRPIVRLRENVDYTTEGNMLLCKRCDRRYDKMTSLKFHVRTKHLNIARFSCNVCEKSFMTLAPLTVHKLEEHNLDDRFKCNACKGAYNTKIQLKKHINNFHMMGERYKCDSCDYETFSFEALYKHKFKHKTVKDYHCKFCRKSFLRKTTKDLHERIHTGDRRKVCTVCGQAFVQKASLNYHMSKYHPEVNF